MSSDLEQARDNLGTVLMGGGPGDKTRAQLLEDFAAIGQLIRANAESDPRDQFPTIAAILGCEKADPDDWTDDPDVLGLSRGVVTLTRKFVEKVQACEGDLRRTAQRRIWALRIATRAVTASQGDLELANRALFASTTEDIISLCESGRFVRAEHVVVGDIKVDLANRQGTAADGTLVGVRQVTTEMIERLRTGARPTSAIRDDDGRRVLDTDEHAQAVAEGRGPLTDDEIKARDRAEAEEILES